MRLYQLASGYRYNTDTMLLSGFAISQLERSYPSTKKRPFRVLDIGAGCGVLGFMLARFLHSHLALKFKGIFSQHQKADSRIRFFKNASKYLIDSIDIQQPNYQLMQHNNHINGFKIRPICEDFLSYDSRLKYDLIICNPPFYSKLPAQNQHAAISRQASYLEPNELLLKASKLLAANGKMFLCYEPAAMSELFAAFIEAKFRLKSMRLVHSSAIKPANLALFELVKNPKITAQILPPLICYKNGKISDELALIYEQAKLISKDFDEFNAM